MGARTWRTTTTCAALLLTATGCMVGPTIKDTPKKPAAATGPIPGNGDQGAPPGWTPGATGFSAPPVAGGSAPGSVPSPVPPPRPTQLPVGGQTAFVTSGNVSLKVEQLSVGPSSPGDAADLARVSVVISVGNSSASEFWPNSLNVQLLAPTCTGVDGSCSKRSGTASDQPQTIPAGNSGTVRLFFAVPRIGLSSVLICELDYKGEKMRFEGRAA